MAGLSDEQQRAPRVLARSPNGRSQAIMRAHGFALDQLATVVLDRLRSLRSVQHSQAVG
jgi:hypothetical protein